MGAPIIANAAKSKPDICRNLLLWQPVLDSKHLLIQHLRLRVAYLMDNELPAVINDEMRKCLQLGNTLDIAGYVLGKELTEAMDTKSLVDLEKL